jgi:hypothetical protein
VRFRANSLCIEDAPLIANTLGTTSLSKTLQTNLIAPDEAHLAENGDVIVHTWRFGTNFLAHCMYHRVLALPGMY